jgi:hypothetical protein
MVKYKYKLLNFQNLLKVYFNRCVVLSLTARHIIPLQSDKTPPYIDGMGFLPLLERNLPQTLNMLLCAATGINTFITMAFGKLMNFQLML